MNGVEGTRVPAAGFVFSALATVVAGMCMSMQSTANGALAGELGNGVFAAAFSFLAGLVVLIVAALAAPSGRRGFGRAVRAIRSGEFPWWMTLGGLAGVMVVISQAFTVPFMGVAVFTMAYIAGQLVGALGVDNTALPPGGKRPPTVWRILGTIIVMCGVSLSAMGVLAQGVPLWAPFLPFVAGLMTVFQQAFNGRLRLKAESAIAANLTNFLTGSIALVLISIVLFALGARVTGAPALPSQWWFLIGGPLGVIFIGTTTLTVARLGVLLLSLMSLVGNLVGSLAIDLTFGSAHAEVNAMTFLSMAVVLAGVLVTNVQGRRRRAAD